MSAAASHPVRQPICPGSGLARATMGLLGLGLLTDVLGIGSSLMQVGLLERVERGELVSPEAAAANDAREQVLGIGQTGLFLFTAILFLVWMHRAYKNLPLLGAPRASFTPGGAVGAWFIPLVNLVRPYQAMAELWRRSGPIPDSEDFATPSSPAIMKAWWGMWIVSNLFGQIVIRTSLTSSELPELITMSWEQAVSSLLGIFSAVLAILVVHDVSARQSEKHRRMLESPPPADPLDDDVPGRRAGVAARV